MMLDMRRTFDEMVQAHAAPDRAATIIANPFYQTISSSFSGTQEYMAMEKLGQLAATGEWDLIVVDTPPSRSALDFLDAPQRMSNFLDGRMIRLLSSPARAGGRGLRKIVGAGFSLFAKAVSTILGGQLLADASAFVQAFDTMFGGFRERATATYSLLRSPGTAFVVVAAPEPDALREAAYFVDRLSTEQMPLAGLVLNRTHPVLAPLSAARARAAADGLRGAPLAVAVLRLHADRVDLADRERRLLSRFTSAHPDVPVAQVPVVAGDVADLDGLRRIGAECAAGRHPASRWPAIADRHADSSSSGLARRRCSGLLGHDGQLRRRLVGGRGVVRVPGLDQQVGPGPHVRPVAQQGPALPLGHPAPHAELDAVVQGVREALGADRAAAAELTGLALPGADHEQPLGVARSGTAPRPASSIAATRPNRCARRP